jgi:hypothetical protein
MEESMELLTFLAADYANIAQGGKINVMGIFRNIYATHFPARHPSMYLVVKLGADLGEYGDDRALIIKLLDADAHELMRYESQIKIPQPQGGQRPEVNALLQINDIVFPNPGRYQFSVQVDKDVKGTFPIDIDQINNPKLEDVHEK